MEHVLQRQEGAAAGGDDGAAALCKLWRHRVLQLTVQVEADEGIFLFFIPILFVWRITMWATH
jgi:hypothetical protein